MLGRAEPSEDNPFRSYGYPSLGQYQAAFASGKIVGCVECPDEARFHAGPVQLESSQIAPGMSGSAVLDTARNLVVGIVAETWFPDATTKHWNTVWAVNARVLTFDPPASALRPARRCTGRTRDFRVYLWHGDAMRYTTVFFDMGGTLALRQPARHDILGRFLQERGLAREAEAVLRAYLSADGHTYRRTAAVPMAQRTDDFWRALRRESHTHALRHLDVPGDVEVLLEEFLAVLRATPRTNAVYDDVPATLGQLRARGVKLAIVSNWNHTLEAYCAELGLCEYFQAIVGSYDVGVEKPDPDIFRIALSRVGAGAAETLHVGDLVPTDVRGAQAAGITPVLIDRDGLHSNGEYVRITRLDDVIHGLLFPYSVKR